MTVFRPSAIVIPAQAGTHLIDDRRHWVPAFAGMTGREERTEHEPT